MKIKDKSMKVNNHQQGCNNGMLERSQEEIGLGHTGQNGFDICLEFNLKRKNISLGQPRTESDRFLFKFQLKVQGNWAGAGQNRMCLISM